MESSEELREALVGMQREVERLRTETAHGKLLVDALEALLCDEEGDPFSGVFAALRSVFCFSQSIVLAEREGGEGGLDCVVAEPDILLATQWSVGRFFRKVLDGRVAATFSNEGLEEWHETGAGLLSPSQPALYLPMRVRNRRGLLMLLRHAGEPGFDRNHVVLARKFALLASHAFAARHAHQNEAESQRLRSLTERLQQTQRALSHRANHDQLTGLPNRAFMQERVERALSERANGDRIAVAFVDLDNFKQVNDLHNHLVGDALLKTVASRIRANIRDVDVVGRISGDEFLILFERFEDVAELHALAERVLGQLKAPLRIDGIEVQASASIGIAVHPEHGTDYDTLRRNADTAMYKAKTGAKGSVACFDEEMGSVAAARLSLEQRLRAAVRERRFRAAFQPKVDLTTRQVVGFEALARWVDGDGTVHGPGEFIEAAGEFGLLNEITGLILADVVRSIPRLDAVFGSKTRFCINISARQASDPAYMEAFVSRLALTTVPHRFVLELTEDAFVTASIFEAQILPLLRAIDVRVSIDDFGTGYSSLSALADITADELKVDRSFISAIHQRPRSQSILKAMESLGNALGMTLIAEGVETDEEVAYLLSKTSIQIAQGFRFSPPVFLEELLSGEWRSARGLKGLADEAPTGPSLWSAAG